MSRARMRRLGAGVVGMLRPSRLLPTTVLRESPRNGVLGGGASLEKKRDGLGLGGHCHLRRRFATRDETSCRRELASTSAALDQNIVDTGVENRQH